MYISAVAVVLDERNEKTEKKNIMISLAAGARIENTRQKKKKRTHKSIDKQVRVEQQ